MELAQAVGEQVKKALDALWELVRLGYYFAVDEYVKLFVEHPIEAVVAIVILFLVFGIFTWQMRGWFAHFFFSIVSLVVTAFLIGLFPLLLNLLFSRIDWSKLSGS